ncbi:MAG: hypothetical protein Q8M76_10500 [Spirochaetaceae bacterium]|nr:hypothetical protein [Spirochaetaceae bacterium]
MADVLDCPEAYPISAKSAAHTPAVFRSGLEALDGLPWTAFPGRAWQASATSRASPASGTARLAMGSAVIREELRPEGFLVAVFSFKSEDATERAALRELGLERRLFLFAYSDIDDRDLGRSRASTACGSRRGAPRCSTTMILDEDQCRITRSHPT